jgi:alanine racemase
MARPLTAEINLNALKHNAAAAKTRCLGARLFGVVKADAYGHGLQRVIPALNGLDGFSVIEIESASFIRDQGDLRRILLLEGVFDSAELQEASVRQFDLVVHAVEQSRMLVAAKLSKPLNIFLKVNTGMNRLGISLGLVEEQLATLRSSRNVRDIVLMTHFADADGESGVLWQADLSKASHYLVQIPLH